MDPKKLVSIIMTIGAIVLLLVSIAFPWATMDGSVSVLGRDLNADIDLYPHKMTYDVNVTTSGAGIGGGLGGGIIGGLGGGLGGGMEREGSISYLSGMDSVGELELAGEVVFGAEDPVVYRTIILHDVTGESLAEVDVRLDRDGPLWWPVGMEQSYIVTLEVNDIDDDTTITIDSLQFNLYYDYNEDKANSNTEDRHVPYDKLMPFSPVDVDHDLTAIGSNWTYTYEFTVDDLYEVPGESTGRFGIGVDVSFTATDSTGTEVETDRSGSADDLPPANDRIQITTAQTAKIAMLGATFPLILLAVALGAIGVLLTLKKHAKTRHLLLVVGIVSVLPPLFFYIGVGVFSDILSVPWLDIGSWVSISPMIALPIIAAVMFFIGCFFEWEEEEEELVSFEVEGADGEKIDEAPVEEESAEDVEEIEIDSPVEPSPVATFEPVEVKEAPAVVVAKPAATVTIVPPEQLEE